MIQRLAANRILMRTDVLLTSSVYGYQKGSPDAFGHEENSPVNLNGNYVDGISISSGYPHKHLWSYVAGLQDNFLAEGSNFDYPCSTGSLQWPPSHVGNDYFCESGNPGH